MHDDKRYIDVAVNFYCAPFECPWGYNGVITWSFAITDNSGNTTPQTQDIPIRLYGVAKDIAPYYKKERVPIEFLDLMVLPVNNFEMNTMPIITLRDWQNWVVGRCFASTADTTTNVSMKAIHSYIYDTWWGQSKFVKGDKQAIFALDDWLQKRNTTEANTINCYDQSALTQVALALGTRAYILALSLPSLDVSEKIFDIVTMRTS